VHPSAQSPPNSVDFDTCVFYLFPKVKSALKGIRFQSFDEVKLKKKTADLQNRVSVDEITI
jgi:hypothetical protein